MGFITLLVNESPNINGSRPESDQTVGQRTLLPYAPRRRPWIRWSLICVSVLLLGVVIRWWGQPLWTQAEYLLQQRRLMTFVQPSGMVIYEEESAQVTKFLLADKDIYVFTLLAICCCAMAN